MFGKIYHKLYFSFLAIFIATLLIVLFFTARFYASRIHNEINETSLTHARFLLNEYREACAAPLPGDAAIDSCERFFDRIDNLHFVRFWILDAHGNVRLTHEKFSPEFSGSEIQRAAAGQEVATFSRRGAERIILPVKDSSGVTQELFVLQGTLLRHRQFPRFPLILSLVLSGLVIALLVLPLSFRITKPIRELHEVGQQWAEGHLDHRTRIRGNDEISELGKVFNMMASNLQKILDERKEFLAFISHELKSPLARIKLSLDLLAQSPSEEEKANVEKGMHEDIALCEKLIDQLLLISRIEMSLPATRMEKVNMVSVIQKVIQQFQPVASNANVAVEFEIRSDHSSVVDGDEGQLRSALNNIVGNAIKFSLAGGRVQVRLLNVDHRLKIEVQDQGIGLDSEEVPKIFEPFYRGKKNADKEGNGLGLFIARRIVELHNGRIEAKQNQPEGTVISIDLPLSNG